MAIHCILVLIATLSGFFSADQDAFWTSLPITNAVAQQGKLMAAPNHKRVVPKRTIVEMAQDRLLGAIFRLMVHSGMTEAEVDGVARFMGGIHHDQLEFYSFNVIPSFYTITDRFHGLQLLYRADKKGTFKLDYAHCLPLFDN